MTRRGHYLLLGILALLLLFAVGSAHAQTADLHDASGSFDGLLQLIQNSASTWDSRLRGYATTLFWGLALIQFVWVFFPLIFKQADFAEIVGELIRFILVIGFFFALLTYSAQWGQAVVDSFRQAGGNASGLGSAMRPGDIFGVAIELAKTVGNVETWNPLTATLIALAGLLVLLCFAFIAAFMALTIIESYIVINASVLFMGFGGSQWTREFALAIARYAVAVGAKLFVLTLLVGLVVGAAKTWQAAYNQDDASMWTMVGLALACAYLTKTIPELVAGMISGTSQGGGGAIGMMAAAAAAGAAAAAAVATGGAAAVGAAAAEGAGGAAAGSGGLAGAINSSMVAGDTGMAAASSAAPAGGTIGGSSSGFGQAAKAAAAAPRVGGGSGNSGASNSGNNQPRSASAQPAGQGSMAPSGGSNLGTRGAVKTAGIMSALAVPGMESAAGISMPPPPDSSASTGSMAPTEPSGTGPGDKQ